MRYKHIFILCTGRSGSSSFIKACEHINNYTANHESLSEKHGEGRFSYSEYHIEGDNRLSWFLGQLGEKFLDNETLYVHLVRNESDTVASFNRRWNSENSIIKAFSEGILKTPIPKLNNESKQQVCVDYYITVNSNINYFLQNKPHTLSVDFNQIKNGFKMFWDKIDAEGNIEKALSEFNILHNKSNKNQNTSIKYRLKLFLLKFK